MNNLFSVIKSHILSIHSLIKPNKFNLLACLLAITAITVVQAAPKSNTIYKDWIVRCDNEHKLEKNICHISQTLTNKESGKTVLHVAIGTLPNGIGNTAIFTLPLGVALKPGIAIQVDDGDLIKAQYNICKPNGCIAALQLTNEQIKTFKAGTQAFIKFANLKGKVISVGVSLRGITAGLNALAN